MNIAGSAGLEEGLFGLFAKGRMKLINCRWLKSMFFCWAVLPALVPFAVRAADSYETPLASGYSEKVSLELYAGSSGTDGKISLALRQVIEPGWHTYWRNPGDSGEPIRLNWTLPEGVKAHDLQWPVPQALPYFDLINLGYKDEAVLLTSLDIPPDVNGPLDLALDAVLLVCSDICIPQDFSLKGRIEDTSTLPFSSLIEQAGQHLPLTASFDVSFKEEPGKLNLVVQREPEAGAAVNFFPYERSAAYPSLAQPPLSVREGFALELERSPDQEPLQEIEGLLWIEDADGARAYETKALPLEVTEATAAVPGLTLIQALIMAFAGGLLLNLMPCVFPVLSIKALHLVQTGVSKKGLAQGMAYTAGVLVAFASLACLLILLRQGGSLIGWGFHLQSPVVIGFLACLMFTMGLWLSGLFEAGYGLMNLGGQQTDGHGPKASFFTGVLAVLVAAPCTAPLMAPAIGFALTLEPLSALAIFLFLGAGLAFPFLLLSAFPTLLVLLPRPGPWMKTLKEVLAYPMYFTALWLIWVLYQQAGITQVMAVLAGFILIAFALTISANRTRTGRLGALLAAGVAVILVLLPVFGAQEKAKARSFSAAALEELLDKGQPVFINMTAAWCVSCLVNERLVLSTDAFRQEIKKRKIAYLEGDWTDYDPEITRFLEHHGRSGVPVYAYFPAGSDRPVLLPQILSLNLIFKEFSRG